jgi:hypothetical protein
VSVDVERRYWLDCPEGGAQDVTDEWTRPTREGGSYIRHEQAAEAMGLEWPVYQRKTAPLGWDSSIEAALLVRVLTCPGCRKIARVWVRDRPTDVAEHKRRAIDVATGPRARRGKCGGACLNGKRSCDCQCRGRCHGAGTCQCGVPSKQLALGAD